MELFLAGDRVVKEAGNASEQARLASELQVLRTAAHPGVVVLAGVEGEEPAPSRLHLLRIEGPTLAARPTLPVEAAAGWAAAVATVLGDLHDLGLAHGSVVAEHVLFDRAGRPVLCGFGSAGPAGSGPEAQRRQGRDVADLARLLAARVPRHEVRLHRLLDGWTKEPAGRRRGRARSARRFAADLVATVPGAHLAPLEPEDTEQPAGSALTTDGNEPASPGEGRGAASPNEHRAVPGDGSGRAHRWPRSARGRRWAPAVVVAAAAVFTGGVWVTQSGVDRRPASRTPGRQEVSGPDGTYVLETAVGRRQTALEGRWGCGPLRPAVLDTATVRSGCSPAGPPQVPRCRPARWALYPSPITWLPSPAPMAATGCS